MIPGINRNPSLQAIYFRLSYYVLFGLVFFIILAFVYNAEVFYYKLQPFFTFDSSYSDYYLSHHNGLLIIISQFVLQFLLRPLFGTILVVILLLLLSFVIYMLAGIKRIKYLNGIEFLPSILILASLKNYNLGIETLILLLIVITLLLLLRIIPEKLRFLRPCYHLIAIVLLFFLFGMMTTIAYTILGIVLELIHSRRSQFYFSITIFFIVPAYLIYNVTGFSIAKIILESADSSKTNAIMPFYWHCIIIILLIQIITRLLTNAQGFERLFIRFSPLITQSLTIVMLLILGVVFNKYLFINSKKYNAQIEFYAGKSQWRKVLAFKDKVTIDDRISIFELNRSLYHKGIMMENLFSIPQLWGVHSLFLTSKFDKSCPINSSDLYYELGFIKAAQYWALEAQTYNPYSPRILQRLLQSALLLDDERVAQKYLTILSHSPVYHKWSENMYRKYIDKNEDYVKKEMLGDIEVNYDILFINGKEPDLDLIQILQKDSNNRMAVEYLLSYYLLECRLGSVEHFLKQYGGYNPQNLPTIYQEAMLMRQLMKKIPDQEFSFIISKQVKNKMAKFNKILIEYNFDEKKARKDLFRLYGGSFWYYFRYLSPLSTGARIKF
jgi:hypothetical protein